MDDGNKAIHVRHIMFIALQTSFDELFLCFHLQYLCRFDNDSPQVAEALAAVEAAMKSRQELFTQLQEIVAECVNFKEWRKSFEKRKAQIAKWEKERLAKRAKRRASGGGGGGSDDEFGAEVTPVKKTKRPVQGGGGKSASDDDRDDNDCDSDDFDDVNCNEDLTGVIVMATPSTTSLAHVMSSNASQTISLTEDDDDADDEEEDVDFGAFE